MSRTPVGGSPKHSVAAGDAGPPRLSRSAKPSNGRSSSSSGSRATSRESSKGRASSNGSPTPPPAAAGLHGGGVGGGGQLEDKEELRLRELEEARARAAQMEKTMRWWSDCTANWREKWGKVRAERNKAREEVRQLRMKLEAVAKEAAALRRERQETAGENERLQKALERQQACSGAGCASGLLQRVQSPTAEDGGPKDYLPERDTAQERSLLPPAEFTRRLIDRGKMDNSHLADFEDLHQPPQEGSPQHQRNHHHHHQAGSPRHSPAHGRAAGPIEENGLGTAAGNQTAQADGSGSGSAATAKSPTHKVKELASPSDEVSNQRMIMLELRMEEATKTIQVERDEKDILSQQIDRLQKELSVLRNQHDEVRDAKQQVVKELNLMRAEHQRELGRVTSDLDDELNCRSSMDMRISDMRKELERLQAENAMEWGKRERLETEKLALERDNKKLKAEIADLKEHLAKKNKQVAADLQVNLKATEEELLEKNKELGELRHTQGKLKKLLQEKSAELDHTLRRAEQHEAEVKKLRGRVDELKRELAKAEDEVDQQSNMVRKLQRNLDENQQSSENMAVQVEHLQARLRSMPTSTSSLAKKRAASFSFSSGNLTLQDTRDEVTSDIDI